MTTLNPKSTIFCFAMASVLHDLL